jgi:uncharacterized protein YjbI with pentapeptide repeats
MELAKAGTAAIDEWRRMHPAHRFDLSGVDLESLDLPRADLREANLRGFRSSGANLHRARLSGADLTYADLHGSAVEGADLSGADLSRASLRAVSFGHAILVGADLSDADVGNSNFRGASLNESWLYRTNFTGAWLDQAELRGAHMWDTVLVNTDLTNAVGVESIDHRGPSLIDERTIRISWPLPDVFLRGVGFSDDLIAFCQSTYGSAIEFYSCFISYSSADQDFARRLHADLQEKGVRCWFAPEDLRIGDRFRIRIDEAIRLHDKLLLILSAGSVQSAWVEEEVESAMEKERRARSRGEDRTVLFPIRLDDAVMESDTAWAASIRRTRHIGDFTRWKDHDAYQAEFERLMRDLAPGSQAGEVG